MCQQIKYQRSTGYSIDKALRVDCKSHGHSLTATVVQETMPLSCLQISEKRQEVSMVSLWHFWPSSAKFAIAQFINQHSVETAQITAKRLHYLPIGGLLGVLFLAESFLIVDNDPGALAGLIQ
ncbi:TPA: NADH:ubiquinone dehydrogenase subunit 6 [Trebouxia sp. C0004]